jgi:membrane fusion protein (multidrug efflux system)
MLKKVGIVLSALVVLSAVGGCAKKKAAEEVKVPVKVSTAEVGNVVQSIAYTGEIQAEFEVKVFAKLPDRIEKYYVDIGSRVAAGAPIAKIYAATLEQGVRQAEAGLAAARVAESNMSAEFARAERLFRENAMSKQQYDAVSTQAGAAKAQLEQAEAAVASIKDQYAETLVKAPISGIVGERYYEQGDMANPAMPLVRIVRMDRMKLILQAAEQDLGRLAVGQETEVRVKSYSDRVFKGRVSKISPVLDPMTRMARVEVLVPNPGYKLKSGMFAEAEVKTGMLKNVLTVPRYATIENTSMETVAGIEKVVKKYFVFVVSDSGKAEQRPIEVSYVNQVNIAVKSGLKLGETIVVSGQNSLRDGMAVAAVQ